jgi:hypothetical protein
MAQKYSSELLLTESGIQPRVPRRTVSNSHGSSLDKPFLDLQEGSCDKTQQADIASHKGISFRFFPYDYFRFYFLHRHFCTILPDLML